MNTRLMMIGSALMASILCMPVMAQPGPGMGGPGMSGAGVGQRGAGPGGSRDCMQSANPEACKAHQQARIQAREACKDIAGPDRRQCMAEQMQNFDCGKSGNPQQCEARKKVYQECKGQTGPAFRNAPNRKCRPPNATPRQIQNVANYTTRRVKLVRTSSAQSIKPACENSSASSSRHATVPPVPVKLLTGTFQFNLGLRKGSSSEESPL
jgi:hypothetical protein